MTPEEYADLGQRIVLEIGKVIVGQSRLVREVITCLLTEGHALIEGVPGLGKTMLLRTLAQVVDLQFARIQFTPDLMPADIVGTQVLTEDVAGHRQFTFSGGPIFANLVLADEVNRATPRTQSALLEAMQERSATVAGETRLLPRPFFVMATQNPLEMEGTYPLPEAQLDRFLLKIQVDLPEPEEIVDIVDRTTSGYEPEVSIVASVSQVMEMISMTRLVPVARHLNWYAAQLVSATHPARQEASPLVQRYVRFGSSPRGAQALILAAKATALLDGRLNVAEEDIAQVAPAALRHRLIPSYEALADGVTNDDLVSSVLEHVPSPKKELEELG